MSARKFILSVLIFIFGLFIIVNPANAKEASSSAKTSTPSASIATPSANLVNPSLPPNTQPLGYVTPNSPQGVNLFAINLMHTASCIIVGYSAIGQGCVNYQITQNAQGAIQGVPVLAQVNFSGGLLGMTGSLIGSLYNNQPVKTVDYLASVGKNLGIVKQVSAQAPVSVPGSGSGVLSPILALWQVSRNISYIVMILIFLIVGLMVMFRSKLNPQTVINVQAALPGLVIGLILITFSYLMAALISDMAFVGTNVVGAYFSAVREDPGNPENLVEKLSNRSVLSIFTPFTRAFDQTTLHKIISAFWNDLADPNRSSNPFDLDPQRVIQFALFWLMMQFFSPFGAAAGGLGSIVAGVFSAATAISSPIYLVSVGLSLIAMLALIYAMFRLVLRLINSYLTIIFLTITAPFQFLYASLPGRQGVFTDWALSMLGNALAFPAVIAVFYFVAFILGPDFITKRCDQPNRPCPFQISEINQLEYNNLVPTAYAQQNGTKIVGTSAFPLFGGLDLTFIQILLAFGALIALPSIPDIIIRTVGKVSEAGEIAGRELGANVAAGQRYYGELGEAPRSIAGQLGRVTNTYGYAPKLVPKDPKDPTKGTTTIWEYSPITSQAGSLTKAKLWFGKKFGRSP